MVDLLDVVNSSRGKDSRGNQNANLSISKQLIDVSDRLKTLNEAIITTPELNLIFNGDYIIVDLKFPSVSSAEIRIFWKYLEDFGKMQNEYFGKVDTPIFNLVVSPAKYAGQYFYTLINPVNWALQPVSPGLEVNVIRMLFTKEALNVFSIDDATKKKLESEVEREMHEEDRLIEQEAIKAAERDEYLDNLNKQFNHMER